MVPEENKIGIFVVLIIECKGLEVCQVKYRMTVVHGTYI